ncbi:MAG TPA: hypothetical protein VLY63_00165 [Anaerolineae bacterium]|nr:hypothetical protein [Anaerolineae bacterium]
MRNRKRIVGGNLAQVRIVPRRVGHIGSARRGISAFRVIGHLAMSRFSHGSLVPAFMREGRHTTGRRALAAWSILLLFAVVGAYLFLLLAQEAWAISEYLGQRGAGVSAPVTEPVGSAQVLPTDTVSMATATPTVTHTTVLSVTPSLTATAVLPTASATPAIISPSATITLSPTPTYTSVSATITPSPSPMPTPTATPFAMLTALPPSRVILASESLWGTAQTCTAGAITNPDNSIDLAFNDLVASCGPFADGDTWTYITVQDTTFASVAGATLEVRFFITGLTNDEVSLQVDNGLGWQAVATFQPGSPPPGSLETLTYLVSDLFTNPAEVNAAQIRFVTSARVSPDPILIYLDEARVNVVDVIETPTPLPPLPTPTAPPPAPTAIPVEGDPHVDYTPTTYGCAGCHRTHTAGGIVLRQTWPEENLCFGCHTSAGPGSDVQLAFTNYTNTDTRFFKHDVAITNGSHQAGEMEGGDFGGSSRHVECEDCHEPHEATRGSAVAPMLQREANASSGVDPVWTEPGAPNSFVWLPQAEREYQICFKCHSTFTTLPTYTPDGWDGDSYVSDGLPKLTYADPQVPDSRDMAQEFNPYNASFHPVVTQGRNQSIPAASFVNGWSQTSMTYCTDCHYNANAATEGLGPHGSPRLHILGGQAEYSTVSSSGSRVDGQEICFNCHNYDTYVTGLDSSTNFPDHSRHLDNSRGTTCYTCHDTHGSEQLHLINFDASTMSFLDGRNSQTAWYLDGIGQAGCYLVCHGRRHEPLTYTP